MEIKRGFIYYADLGERKGSLQKGKRPVIVVSNNACNMFSSIVTVLPITSSKTKSQLPTHVNFSNKWKQHNKILCEQPISIDVNELKEQRGYPYHPGNDVINRVDRALSVQLHL